MGGDYVGLSKIVRRKGVGQCDSTLRHDEIYTIDDKEKKKIKLHG